MHELKEVTSFAAPPQAIKDMMYAVMLLLGQPNPKDFTKAKKLLKSDLIPMIKSKEIPQIDLDSAFKAKDAIKNLTADQIKKTSLAAVGLFSWVSAMVEAVLSQCEADTAKGSKS